MNADSKYKCELLKDTKIADKECYNRNDKRYFTINLCLCSQEIVILILCRY